MLKKILKKIENNASDNGLAYNSYATAKRSLYIAFISLIVAAYFGFEGIKYMKQSPTSEQISDLQKKDSMLLAAQITLANLNIESSNIIKRDFLRNKINKLNDIIFLMSDIENATFLVLEKKKKHISFKTTDVQERLYLIYKLTDILKQLYDIDILIPNKGLLPMYNDLTTKLIKYKLLYKNNQSLGSIKDTTLIGNNSYENLILSVNEFKDSVLINIDYGRERLIKNLNSIEAIIDSNNKLERNNHMP